MKNIRYLIRFIFAFISRFKGLLLLGVIFGIVIFFLMRIIYPMITNITSETIGIAGRYHAGNLPNYILNQVSSGLTAVDESGAVIPSLAK